MSKLFIPLIFILFILPLSLLAQVSVNLPYALSNELNVEVLPDYPGPNEQVSVVLTMYTADLDSSTIAWYVDGKLVTSGKGLKRFTFTAPAAGAETKVEIKITLQNGTSFSKSFSINPVSVDVLWEADAYVPPFYRGKAMHPPQGRLKLVANPEFNYQGSRIDPSRLIYEWSNGITVLESQSGYGKNIVFINGALLGGQEQIELLVRDPVHNLTAQAFVNIDTTNPELVFYKNDPYYGYMFDNALPSIVDLKTDEVQIVASPYFVTKERSSILQYEWRLNGQNAPELQSSRTAIFRKPEGQSGESSIRLNVSNLNRILQYAEGNLTVKFKNEN